MSERLKILHVTAELAPFATTGGLGDVSNALPRALKELGHDVRVAMPCYGFIPPEHRGQQHNVCVADIGYNRVFGALRIAQVPDTDIPLYLVEHDDYFDRPHLYGEHATDYPDNLERFCFFSLALLHGLPQTDWTPDVIHCHDWHTAVIPTYLRAEGREHPVWSDVPCLFTIHNLAYQGSFKLEQFPLTGLTQNSETLASLEHQGKLNLMKGAILCADKVNTVSPRYAREIQTPDYGHGLDRYLLRRKNDLTGILNGVDYSVWHPTRDKYIPANYSADDLSGKAVCKAKLQERLGLPVGSKTPVFAMVTRFERQKGLDLVELGLDSMLAHDLQFIILGTGDPYYEEVFPQKSAQYPDKMQAIVEFDAVLSHWIQAGADFFLMPSHFEPSGLSQLYSLVYGTTPVVRKTGGLADSVNDVTPATLKSGKATGVVFEQATTAALLKAIHRALKLYEDPAALRQVRRTGMAHDFSWDLSARSYVQLYYKTLQTR